MRLTTSCPEPPLSEIAPSPSMIPQPPLRRLGDFYCAGSLLRSHPSYWFALISECRDGRLVFQLQ